MIRPAWNRSRTDTLRPRGRQISFWFENIFQHPALRGLEYGWRLDTDSFILSPVRYDVFALMRARRYAYGYVSLEEDTPSVTHLLWEEVEEHLARHQLAAAVAADGRLVMPRRDDMPRTPVPTYYNNFEVSFRRLSLTSPR